MVGSALSLMTTLFVSVHRDGPDSSVRAILTSVKPKLPICVSSVRQGASTTRVDMPATATSKMKVSK